MEIRFKNGLPLMVNGGLIAGSQSCCCENPPPSKCVCGGTCSYFIELVEPLEIAVKTQAFNCSIGASYANKIVEATLWEEILPATDVNQVASFSSATVQNAGSFLDAFDRNFLQGRPAFPGGVGVWTFFKASSRASVRVSCSNNTSDGSPEFVANLFIMAEAEFYNLGGGGSRPYWRRSYNKTFKIPATCTVSPKRECVTTERRFLRIDTPLEITLNGDGTSSLGSLGSAITSGSLLTQNKVARDSVDAILAASIYTFRITARESCGTVPADCDVPLQGNRIIYFGFAEDNDFVLGTPKSTTIELGAVTYNFEHYGTAAGTTADPWVFNAKRVRNADNRTIEEHNVELFCGLDESVSPAVSRWYVREYTYCTPEFGQQTTGQWIGVVESYEASSDCNGIAVGDPVPAGRPVYEEVDGYPVVDFGDPCVPPSPIGLEITDLCP